MFDNIEKNILGLVVFDDIKIHYPVDQDLRVVFTIDPSVRASTRDWVGIYPVGWSAFESCLTYLWGIGRHFENSCRTRYLVFKARDLRKATCGTHYQFVYVSKYLEVLGVSQYFQFRTSETLVEAARNASKLYMRFVANDSSILSEPTLNNSMSHNCKLAAAHQRKVFTTCGQCKNLFDTQEMNSGLAKKVDNLEKTVEDLKTQKLSGLPSSLVWDEDIERTRFHKFLNNIYNPPKPDGSGEKKSFESRLSAVKSLVCAMDDVIAKAEKIKVGLQKMIESPIDGELCLANSNAIGSLAGSAGPEDPVRSEPPVQELPQRQGSSHAS